MRNIWRNLLLLLYGVFQILLVEFWGRFRLATRYLYIFYISSSVQTACLYHCACPSCHGVIYFYMEEVPSVSSSLRDKKATKSPHDSKLTLHKCEIQARRHRTKTWQQITVVKLVGWVKTQKAKQTRQIQKGLDKTAKINKYIYLNLYLQKELRKGQDQLVFIESVWGKGKRHRNWCFITFLWLRERRVVLKCFGIQIFWGCKLWHFCISVMTRRNVLRSCKTAEVGRNERGKDNWSLKRLVHSGLCLCACVCVWLRAVWQR